MRNIKKKQFDIEDSTSFAVLMIYVALDNLQKAILSRLNSWVHL